MQRAGTGMRGGFHDSAAVRGSNQSKSSIATPSATSPSARRRRWKAASSRRFAEIR